MLPRGYVIVILRDENGNRRNMSVHRLVGLAFLGAPPTSNHTDIAHNDGNPTNNEVGNLRWSTRRDNQMDMRKHGTMQDGEKCVTCKITAKQAKKIRRQAQTRGEGRKLAMEFGLSTAQISRIKNGRRWRSLS